MAIVDKVYLTGPPVPKETPTYGIANVKAEDTDVFTNAAFGSVSVTDANALRPAGSSWVVPGSVTANAAAAYLKKTLDLPAVCNRAILASPRTLGDGPEAPTMGDLAAPGVTLLIYMNNPLRYAGLTFYQASFEPGNDRVTILQVVRNPSWLIPYIACSLMSLGLVWQFTIHLVGFVGKRRAREALARA